ncbi:MAG: hypothetical protein LBL90_11285 [Prevotellaceae bacterium]|jgi:hypothetical protein|nr:hypothetical protein [Prevotellaceae bacterium]
MKKIYVAVIVFLLPLLLNAQDSIKKMIANYQTPKSELIAKARLLLFDKFEIDDISTVKKVSDYIYDSLTDKQYMGLWPYEKILIDYWAADYNSVFTGIFKLDSIVKSTTWITQITPQRDLLYQNLLNKSSVNYNELANKIDNSSNTDEEKAFLHLYLRKILIDPYEKNNAAVEQSDLNQRANEFVEVYFGSRFEDIVKRQVREEYILSKGGWGFEFFGGFGAFTGDLHNTYTNHGSIGLAFELGYKNFTSQFRMYAGFNKIKKDIPFSYKGKEYIWEKDEKAITGLFDINIGYAVCDVKAIKVIPFASIGVLNISSKENKNDYPELKEVEKSSFTYGIGVCFDFKFRANSVPAYLYKDAHKSYGAIRLRYSYNINNFSGLSGNFHTITLGITAFVKKGIFRYN